MLKESITNISRSVRSNVLRFPYIEKVISSLSSSVVGSGLRGKTIIGTTTTQCFDALGNLCWSYQINGSMINFNLTCKTVSLVAPAWCAVGLNIDGHSMAPTEVFFLARLQNNTVVLEDRYNKKKHDPPVCINPQVSTNVIGNLATDGTLSAQWSRPLEVKGDGLITIVPGTSMNTIAAWAELKDQQINFCEMGWGKHSLVYSNTTTF